VKKIKQTNEYGIFQKRSGRYAVRDVKKQWVHGEDKTKVLLAEGLVKLPEPKPAAPAEPEEAPASEDTPAS
jgi:hypothetical protein